MEFCHLEGLLLRMNKKKHMHYLSSLDNMNLSSSSLISVVPSCKNIFAGPSCVVREKIYTHMEMETKEPSGNSLTTKHV